MDQFYIVNEIIRYVIAGNTVRRWNLDAQQALDDKRIPGGDMYLRY